LRRGGGTEEKDRGEVEEGKPRTGKTTGRGSKKHLIEFFLTYSDFVKKRKVSKKKGREKQG